MILLNDDLLNLLLDDKTELVTNCKVKPSVHDAEGYWPGLRWHRRFLKIVSAKYLDRWAVNELLLPVSGELLRTINQVERCWQHIKRGGSLSSIEARRFIYFGFALVLLCL
jgi:hypothetical protein